MSPKVSIIIPVYNARDYVCRCIDSILSQSFEDFELIIVDDGSTDGSESIIDDYVKKDDRIIVFHRQNCGASLSRKFGLENCSGEYIVFVDSDDFVDIDYIKSLFYLLDNSKSNISACKVQRIKVGEKHIDKTKISHSVTVCGDELFNRFFKYEFWGFVGKMYRKSVFGNIVFPKATLSEDYYVMARIFYKEKQIEYVDKALYFYEFHNTSLSHFGKKTIFFDEFENVYSVWKFYSDCFPRYKYAALSNVVETCVKLIPCIPIWFPDNSKKEQEKLMRSFLKRHLAAIILRCSLPIGVKNQAIKLALLS